MSFKAMTWAASVKTGSPTKKLILLLLADRANDEGECFPSLNRIAIDCEMSKRAVQNNIKALGSSGHIEIIHRRTEEVQLSNVYRLRTGGVPDGTGVENEVLGGRERGARGVGNEVPPNQSLESVIEPKDIAPDSYSDDFSVWWEIYKKGNKSKAFTEWKKATLPDDLNRMTQTYLDYCASVDRPLLDGERFLKYKSWETEWTHEAQGTQPEIKNNANELPEYLND